MESEDAFLEKLTSIAEVLDGIRQDDGCIPQESEYIVTLLETYLFSQLALMELLSYDKSCQNARSIIERNTSIGYFDLAIGEGVSYLCGYGAKEKNTKLSGIKKGMPDCDHKKKIIDICEGFKEFCEGQKLTTGEFKLVKEYTKHYWTDYIDAIRHLMTIDNQTEAIRVNSYILMLTELSDCIGDFFNSQPVIKIKTNKIIGEKTLKCPIAEDGGVVMQCTKRIAIDEACMTTLWEAAKMYDKTIKFGECGILSADKAKSLELEIATLMKLSTPVWHIRKVSLDIDYAIKSYFNSENHLERQSSTYRMLIALYGGLTRLFGISDKEQNGSLIANYHKAISDCYDNALLAKERTLKRDLKDFGVELKDRFEQVRDTLIHSRSGNKRKDMVLEKYYLICELCPSEIFDYVVRFSNILQPLREITDAVLAHNYPEIWTRYYKDKAHS